MEEIPRKPDSVDTRVFEPNKHEIYKVMKAGIIEAIKTKKFSYCYRYPHDHTDDWGASSEAALSIRIDCEKQGWRVDIEDMSGLDGTVVFKIS